MADSSTNDTEGPAAADEKAPPREPPAAPPRPPRPAAKRASGSLRIPLPSAVTPGSKLNGAIRPATASSAAPAVGASLTPANDSEPADDDTATEAVTSIATPVPTVVRISTRPPPALVTPAVPGDKSTNYEFALTRRSSAAPPLAFDSSEADPSDRAPSAPLTPWRDVPPLAVSQSASPPVKAVEEDHEDTIVGEVPQNLLELSSEDDENTRAYQAPQELIDMARREREERRAAAASAQKRKRSPDSLLPAGRLSGIATSPEDADQGQISTATVPVPMVDGAPPVARSRGPGDDSVRALRASGSGASLADLARAVSERTGVDSLVSMGREAAPDSEDGAFSNYASPWFTRGRVWIVLVGLFVVVGFALARWRGLDLLLSR